MTANSLDLDVYFADARKKERAVKERLSNLSTGTKFRLTGNIEAHRQTGAQDFMDAVELGVGTELRVDGTPALNEGGLYDVIVAGNDGSGVRYYLIDLVELHGKATLVTVPEFKGRKAERKHEGPVVDWGCSVGRTYLMVGGYAVAMEGDAIRDHDLAVVNHGMLVERFPDDPKVWTQSSTWSTDLIKHVVRQANGGRLPEEENLFQRAWRQARRFLSRFYFWG